MRIKSLAWLFAVTVAALVIAMLVSRGGGLRSDPLAGKPVLPDVANRLQDVTRLSLVHGDQKATLLRKGELWSVEERDGYAADTPKVRQTLLALADLTYVEPKTAQAASYARLEVEDAGGSNSKSTLVTFADERGALMGEVILGKHRADQLGGGEGGIYLRKPGNTRSWLARGNLDVVATTAGWLDKKLVDLPVAQVKEAVLTQPDGSKITLTRDKPEEKLKLAELPNDKKLKYDSVLDDAAGVLGGLQLDDVRAAKGFDFPKDGIAKAHFTSFAGLVVNVELADKDGASWARFTVSGTGDAEKQAADLTARLSPWVYALPSGKAKTLRDKLDDLVEPAKAS